MPAAAHNEEEMMRSNNCMLGCSAARRASMVGFLAISTVMGAQSIAQVGVVCRANDVLARNIKSMEPPLIRIRRSR
ncbi:hypothetical protein BDU57DRAFT_513849 [Ampelomyces quisqualis]|uniref:Uncharacterized protein n=1 Tax=Ampelomyces quisqualis TaxID=50730 RepID=A0A6A5QQA5_AMPQU|nr:hypothetical protein BDU57DRAFT_513849 [Ampelomyces quisqualis]